MRTKWRPSQERMRNQSRLPTRLAWINASHAPLPIVMSNVTFPQFCQELSFHNRAIANTQNDCNLKGYTQSGGNY